MLTCLPEQLNGSVDMVVSVVCVSGDFNVFLPLSGKKKVNSIVYGNTVPEPV